MRNEFEELAIRIKQLDEKTKELDEKMEKMHESNRLLAYDMIKLIKEMLEGKIIK
jgi:hypothetical protein